MAITINSLATPINVTATPTAGGSLAASTTYYVRVSALNRNGSFDLLSNSLVSDPSVEISFVTDATDRSANIAWDAVAGASFYNVFISTVSGDYEGRDHRCNHTTNTTTNTNSYSITAVPGNGYSADTLVSTLASVSGENWVLAEMPFSLDKNLGIISISLTGSDTETLETIASALDAGGYSGYYYYDGTNFGLKGSIRAESTATGKLIFRHKNLFFFMGSLHNLSTSFEMRLGALHTDNQYYGVCNYYPYQYYTYTANIPMYGCTIRCSSSGFGFLGMPNTIGIHISNLDANTAGCTFYNVRNTNTNWSNNSLLKPVMLRAWGLLTITNTYYDTSVPMAYYPRNSVTDFYDSTFRLTSPTTSYHMQMSSMVGDTVMREWANHYDSTFIGPIVSSLRDIIFNINNSIEGLRGFRFWNSLSTSITDEDGVALSGVSVKGYDNTDTLVYDETTDANGETEDYVIGMQVVPLTVGTGPAHYTRTFPATPFTVVLSKDGYETQTIILADIETPYAKIVSALKETRKVRQTIEGKLLLANQPALGSDSKLLEI